MGDKQRNLRKLALAVFKLEMQLGHKKWSVTELSRRTEISRPTIYRSLGKTKDEILRTCLRHFTSQFYGFQGTGGISLGEQLKFARKSLQKYHEAIIFYQKWRSRPGWICDEFRQVESQYQDLLRKEFPMLGPRGARVVHGIFHGFVTAPFLNPDEVKDAVEFLLDKTRLGDLPESKS